MPMNGEKNGKQPAVKCRLYATTLIVLSWAFGFAVVWRLL
jgi:hypothetical protein